MIINKYKITIEKIKEEANNKFKIGDVVRINNRMDNNGKVGIVTEVRDKRDDKNLIEKGRDWYYFVEYDKGGSEVREGNLSLIINGEIILNKLT